MKRHDPVAHLVAPHFCVRNVWLRLSTISPSQNVTTGAAAACGMLVASITPHTKPLARSTPWKMRWRCGGRWSHSAGDDALSDRSPNRSGTCALSQA